MSECLDPKSEWVVGDPIRCQRATQVAMKQKQYHDAIPEGSNLHTRALIWGATKRGGSNG
jgi:hypothetical protein